MSERLHERLQKVVRFKLESVAQAFDEDHGAVLRRARMFLPDGEYRAYVADFCTSLERVPFLSGAKICVEISRMVLAIGQEHPSTTQHCTMIFVKSPRNAF